MDILEELHDIKGQLTAVYYAMEPGVDEEFRRMGRKAADKITEKVKEMEKHLNSLNKVAEVRCAKSSCDYYNKNAVPSDNRCTAYSDLTICADFIKEA